MTLLGYQVERPDAASRSQALGIFKLPGEPTDEGGCEGAIRYFEKGGAVPLIAKADRKSPVHRRVPLDLVVVPVRENGKITGDRRPCRPVDQPGADRAGRGGAGAAPPARRAGEGVRLRSRRAIAARRCATRSSSLPHDLLVNLSPRRSSELVATAMSLADRPRPTLVLVRSILKGHMFAFVWLPRDELTTRRRVAIGEMIEQGGRRPADPTGRSSSATATSRWSATRSTSIPTRADARRRGARPAARRDGARLGAERRGSARRAGRRRPRDPARAHLCRRLSRRPIAPAIRPRTPPRTCSASAASTDAQRARRAALSARPIDAADQLRLKTYRLGGHDPAVRSGAGVREFRLPRARGDCRRRSTAATLGNIHEFALEIRATATPSAVLARAEVVERGGRRGARGPRRERRVQPADRRGRARAARRRAVPRLVPLSAPDRPFLLAGHRGRGAAPRARRRPRPDRPVRRAATIRSSTATRDDGGRARPSRRSTRASPQVAAIDEDRILRLIRGVIAATLRTNAFAPAGARGARLQARFRARARACRRRCRGARSGSIRPRVEGIHLRGGPIARGGLRWSDRRDDFRTEILGLMKAQLVKNAVIVPTGAKGGFYPKQLPPPSRPRRLARGRHRNLPHLHPRLAVGHRQYRRGQGRPPAAGHRARRRRSLFRRRRRQGHRDLLRRRQRDRGVAQLLARRRLRLAAAATATTTRRWASPPGAPGSRSSAISARWASTSRPSRSGSPASATCRATCSATACCCRRRSSWSPRSTTATSSSIPIPIRRASWKERKRLFDLPRSTWDDYDKALISKGGGVFPRSQKIDPAVAARCGRCSSIEAEEVEPAGLITAILKAPVDLLWFGGIGTYIKAQRREPCRGRRSRQRRDPRQRRRASRQGDRRGRQPRHHPGRPDRVRPARRPDQHRLHRQFGRRRLLGQRGQHQDPAQPRDGGRAARRSRSATRCSPR